VRKTCPRAKLTVLEGNHDNAVLRMLSSNAPSMVVGFWERFARDLDFTRLGVEWVPETAQPLKRGNLRLMHGHQIAKVLPKRHAAKVADEWGAPGLTVAFGHSHRPGMHVRAGREGNCRAIAVGAGRTLDPDWMKGRPGGWENELLVAYLLPTGHVAAFSVPLVGGAFIWGGKVYRYQRGSRRASPRVPFS
jgi:hypothetical protein